MKKKQIVLAIIFLLCVAHSCYVFFASSRIDSYGINSMLEESHASHAPYLQQFIPLVTNFYPTRFKISQENFETFKEKLHQAKQCSFSRENYFQCPQSKDFSPVRNRAKHFTYSYFSDKSTLLIWLVYDKELNYLYIGRYYQ